MDVSLLNLSIKAMSGPRLKKALGAKRVVKSYQNNHRDGSGNFGFVIVTQDDSWYRLDGFFNSQGIVTAINENAYGSWREGDDQIFQAIREAVAGLVGEVRMVYGTRTEEWHMAGPGYRDYASGIPLGQFKKMSWDEAKELYLQGHFIGAQSSGRSAYQRRLVMRGQHRPVGRPPQTGIRLEKKNLFGRTAYVEAGTQSAGRAPEFFGYSVWVYETKKDWDEGEGRPDSGGTDFSYVAEAMRQAERYIQSKKYFAVEIVEVGGKRVKVLFRDA